MPHIGILLSQNGVSKTTVPMDAKLPLHKPKGSPFDGYGEYYNMEFVGFNKAKSSCGAKMLAF